MLIFKNKNIIKLPFSVDIHSHLLPGIDDGVATLEEAVGIIKKMRELGYQKIVITPHINSGIFDNTPEIILSQLEVLSNEIKKENIDIEVYAAAEYFVDENFINTIKRKIPILSFGKNKFVMIEFSHISQPLNYQTVIYDLQSLGYSVILAHPERYYYFHHNFDKYRDMYERGVFLQLNILSLTGVYDRNIKKTAEKLIECKLYSFAGTDIHNINCFDYCIKAFRLNTFQKLMKNCNIINDEI